MIILTLRTDKPESEVGLYDDDKQLAYIKWEAHRKLAETLHIKIKDLLDQQKMSWKDIGGLIVYEGPGSFTGLRIGISVANALAYANAIPIVGSGTDNWLKLDIEKLESGKDLKTVLPVYGSEAHITSPKK